MNQSPNSDNQTLVWVVVGMGILLVVFTVLRSVNRNATSDYRPPARDSYTVYPTYPGTDVRDYRKSGVRVEGSTAYPTIPGTDVRDYRQPGTRREGDMVYPTYPGTDLRDYSKPGYRIEPSL